MHIDTRGKFIAIEGLDGAGKSTQIKLLIEYFQRQGIETKFIHFPRVNEGVFGELIARFLRGEFGSVPDVHPQLVALLFAEDRREFSSTLQHWMAENYFVIVDRYVLSNIAFQCAKLKTIAEKAQLRNWINSFEFDHNKIPKPDISFFLDVPFQFTRSSLKQKRHGNERDYLQGKDDIHEGDLSLQMAVKTEYDNIVNIDRSIQRVVCFDSSNKIRSISEIHSDLVQKIEEMSLIKHH